MKAEESSSLGKSSWYLGAQSMLQQVKAYGLSIANTIKVGEVQNRVFNALAPPTRIDTLGLFSHLNRFLGFPFIQYQYTFFYVIIFSVIIIKCLIS